MATLLTGANGFLGKIIFTALVNNNAVITLGRSSDNTLQIDLAREVPQIKIPCNTIIHNAGKAHIIPRNEIQAKAFLDVNYQGTLNLLSGLEQGATLPKQFIYISTVAVYGVEQGEMIAETHPLNGITPYAESKIKAEQAVQEWCNSNGVKCVILRLPLVVGMNPPGNLGAMWRAIQKGYYVKIRGNTARKSAVLGTDVAKLIANDLNDKQGIYNLTDGVHPSFEEIEDALECTTGKRIWLKLSLATLGSFATIGDILAANYLRTPLTTEKLKKIVGTLTFNDEKARGDLNWKPQPVIAFLANFNG